jgi:predicted RNase H-like HicB family nuclease
MAKSRQFTVVLERDREGWIVAKVPALPGCYTQGRTVEQAMKRIREAISVCLETEPRLIPNEFVGVQQVEV